MRSVFCPPTSPDGDFQQSLRSTVGRADLQMLSLYLLKLSILFPGADFALLLPIVIDRLDDEPESRTDCVHIFVHYLLHNRRLAGIVQATGRQSAVSQRVSTCSSACHVQHQDAHLLVLKTRFS